MGIPLMEDNVQVSWSAGRKKKKKEKTIYVLWNSLFHFSLKVKCWFDTRYVDKIN